MKNLLYVVAALLIVIWAIVFLGFNSSAIVHSLLVIALLIVLVRIVFNRKLSSR